jgi:hypothetical protein
MIPMFLRISIRAPGERPIRIWLPLFLIWLLLSPLLLIIIPVVMVLGLLARMNPFAALASLFGVFCALAGTHVEVEAPDASIFVHIT